MKITKQTGGSGWELEVWVKGFYPQGDPDHYAAVEHTAERGAWFTIMYTGQMTMWWKTEDYSVTSYTSGADLEKSTLGTYEWGKTKAKSGFHNWLTKASWT